MSRKLPVISGEDLIRVLRKFGYEIARQKGSHVRFLSLFHSTKKLAPGTLKSILVDACVSAEELLKAM